MADTEKLDAILSEVQKANKRLEKMEGTLNVVDKRLSLIEQRLENIEKWAPLENAGLQYKAA